MCSCWNKSVNIISLHLKIVKKNIFNPSIPKWLSLYLTVAIQRLKTRTIIAKSGVQLRVYNSFGYWIYIRYSKNFSNQTIITVCIDHFFCYRGEKKIPWRSSANSQFARRALKRMNRRQIPTETILRRLLNPHTARYQWQFPHF